MAQEVEINLRIPSLRIPSDGDKPTNIVNDQIRFITRIEVAAIPKPGAVLTLTTSTGLTFSCDVIAARWEEQANRFVIACRFSNRRISPAEYNALISASDWQARPLL